jgi:hypothetical protein
MQSRIANECLGGGFVASTDIQNAIQDAIKEHERQSFYFNEIRDARNFRTDDSYRLVRDDNGNLITDDGGWATTAGMEFYPAGYHPSIGSMAMIRTMVAVISATRYLLAPRTMQWMESRSVNPGWRAMPTDWCWHAGGIRLYPIPDAVYPMIMTGIMRFAPLSVTGDTNPWVVEAEELIRQAAKRRIYQDILRNTEQIQVCQQAEGRALSALKRETARRAGPARIRPHPGYF